MISGLDFNWLADPHYIGWLIRGTVMTVTISVLGVIMSLAIGIGGAAAIHLRIPVLAHLSTIMVDLFRNTPPLVQLFFLYFILSDIGAVYTDAATGNQYPLFSGFTCVVLSLGIFNGAIAIEVIRAGIGTVPLTTVEGARSLGYSRVQTFFRIELPLAMRLSIPAMTSNVISLIKTSSQASLVAVTDITYYSTQIMIDTFLNIEVMIVLWSIYILITTVVVLLARWLASSLRIPGIGV